MKNKSNQDGSVGLEVSEAQTWFASTNLALACQNLWLQITQNSRDNKIRDLLTFGKTCRAQQLHTWLETDVSYRVQQSMDRSSLSACKDDSILHVVALTDRVESPCMMMANRAVSSVGVGEPMAVLLRSHQTRVVNCHSSSLVTEEARS